MEATCIYCTSLHTSPTGRHPSLAIVQLFLLWLSFDIQAGKESLNQARIFKAIWLQVCFFFAIHELALL
jgi:hypothetical protein